MSADWPSIILDTPSKADAWEKIFDAMLDLAQNIRSPAALHEQTVIPDRLLSEAAWDLWEAYPKRAKLTSAALGEWCGDSASNGQAVLILDALSLRELPLLLDGAKKHNIEISGVKVTGSECPSTTNQFAKALNLSSRSTLANDKKPGTFKLFDKSVYTDVFSIPFEDCAVPSNPNLFIWHSWLDDLIHMQNKNHEIEKIVSKELLGDGFWNFINKLRQGRKLVITSDHGYAVSKLFSSEVIDKHAVEILRKTFGASRNKAAANPWQNQFMPPIVMTENNQHVVLGQRKWKIQSGFPQISHGGMSLLEVAVPYMELPSL
ncbi:hypothetical protein [Methanococcoides alaskense]|uniref:PglZ domain-containing protein n=1 Tax=Methanococcoides alaskense TaxID=325778 RepID=A0AA90U123_9EURY|nr:hypothetical protein [Methanococcoides alaskense]MDA0524212.1 hypothetical protein [Methanococcoides alaskense]MDR6223667.1 hypothetical protein [Methanococcoides alaskense]